MQYILTSVIYLPLRKLWLNLSKPLSGFFGHQPVTLDLVFGTVSCSAGFANESMVYYRSHLTCFYAGQPLTRSSHKTGVFALQVSEYPSCPTILFFPQIHAIFYIKLEKQAIK